MYQSTAFYKHITAEIGFAVQVFVFRDHEQNSFINAEKHWVTYSSMKGFNNTEVV